MIDRARTAATQPTGSCPVPTPVLAIRSLGQARSASRDPSDPAAGASWRWVPRGMDGHDDETGPATGEKLAQGGVGSRRERWGLVRVVFRVTVFIKQKTRN